VFSTIYNLSLLYLFFKVKSIPTFSIVLYRERIIENDWKLHFIYDRVRHTCRIFRACATFISRDFDSITEKSVKMAWEEWLPLKSFVVRRTSEPESSPSIDTRLCTYASTWVEEKPGSRRLTGRVKLMRQSWARFRRAAYLRSARAWGSDKGARGGGERRKEKREFSLAGGDQSVYVWRKRDSRKSDFPTWKSFLPVLRSEEPNRASAREFPEFPVQDPGIGILEHALVESFW